MHFCASPRLPALCQLGVWSQCCLQGWSPPLLSRMLCERHSVTTRRGHPKPAITDALMSWSRDEGHWMGAPDGSLVPGLVLAPGTSCAGAPVHGVGQGPRCCWVVGAWGRGDTEQRCRPHARCPQIHTARAKADTNILHKYLMAQDELMLERCLDSRQLFLVLLLGVFPKGKRGVEWVGALAGRNPQPPLFLPKGGTPDTSISGQRR